MSPIRGLIGAWRWAVRKTLGLWVKATIKPDDIAETLAARARPVCYVLENESHADLAVLDDACANLRMPRPERSFALARQSPLLGLRSRSRAPRYLVHMVDSAAADPGFDADLVPVSIFWGRAPQKEQSLWRLLFAENWVLVGRFRKMLNVLVNGRNTVVYFGDPVPLRETIGDLPPTRGVRRLMRSLRGVFRAQRASTIGPDLSHRRTMVAHILRTQSVRHAVRREMQVRRELAEAARGRGRAGLKRRAGRRAVLLTARQYAMEIAANYSQPFVTFMSTILRRLWTWLYDGVEFEHVEKLQEIGDGAEIIYVPCHRSHMDYLLLSYVIYHKGFAVPHVAAGVNLNLPVVGRFLRKGGAFFLRRSFKGHALYAAVFTKYLGFMMARGHPLEYFVEGGRSRTGRLLSPRTGMLSMTVRSYLKEPKRPVVFMPVYFGYERIVEGRTYIGELSGRPKEKESVFGVIKSLPSVLRSKFGTVHVNLGEPIVLDDLLNAYNPDWRGTPDTRRRAGGHLAARLDRRADRRSRLPRRQRDQCRRSRDTHQPRLHGRARDASPGAARGRSQAPARLVPAAAPRCAVRAARHRHHRQRGAHDALRGVDGHAGAPAAPLGRHHANDRGAGGACHLLPQQHPASICDALASRVLFRQQCADANRGHQASRLARLSLYPRRARAALARRGGRCGRRFASRCAGPVRSPRAQRGSQRMAASFADLAPGHPALAPRGSDDPDARALLPGDRGAAAGRARGASRTRRSRSAAI